MLGDCISLCPECPVWRAVECNLVRKTCLRTECLGRAKTLTSAKHGTSANRRLLSPSTDRAVYTAANSQEGMHAVAYSFSRRRTAPILSWKIGRYEGRTDQQIETRLRGLSVPSPKTPENMPMAQASTQLRRSWPWRKVTTMHPSQECLKTFATASSRITFPARSIQAYQLSDICI